MNIGTSVVDGWLSDSSPDLIAMLVNAQTNQRLAELTLFARAVKAHGDAESQRCMEQCMVLARSLPTGALATVISEPEFHYWSYIAGCLRGRLENRESIPVDDVPHLASVPNYANSPLLIQVLDLNRFLLGASLMAGVEARLDLPIHGNELTIPGLGILLQMPSQAPTANLVLIWEESARLFVDEKEIQGFAEVHAAALRKCGNFTHDQLQVLPWVRMSRGAFVINGREPYYRLSWVTSYRNPDGSQYLEVAAEEYVSWEQDLKAAVALLANCWPEMEQEIGQALRAIIPVNSPTDGIHMSCAKDVMSFALLMSKGSPVVLAEALIHEFGHNVLNAIQEFEEVFAKPMSLQTDLYSPWRPDARPISGVLHAVFVFERVCEFYLRYLSRHADEEIFHRFRLMTLRNAIGLDVLQTARDLLGPVGIKLLTMLQIRVHRHANKLTQLDRRLAKVDLLDHYQTWLQANQLAQIPLSDTILNLKAL